MFRSILVIVLLSCCQLLCAQSSPADQDHQISIFFGGGSYYIDGQQANDLKTFLDEIPNIEWYEVELQGRTDDIGNRAYNMRLSEMRVRAVKALLMDYPLPEEMMIMIPLGEEDPTFDNATWEGKLSNRRVDIILKRIVF
ncbi:MAG: OmpA family protein [Bacteroidota bacterium]